LGVKIDEKKENQSIYRLNNMYVAMTLLKPVQTSIKTFSPIFIKYSGIIMMPCIRKDKYQGTENSITCFHRIINVKLKLMLV